MNNKEIFRKTLERYYKNPYAGYFKEDEYPAVMEFVKESSTDEFQSFIDMISWRRGEETKEKGIDAVMKLESKFGVFADFRRNREVLA